jgi:hypothetical protein
VSADESHAPGALTYQIYYGDGATDQNTAPTVCQGGPGPAANETWQLFHTYSQSGTYTVTVTVLANCTSDRTTNTVTVTIG